MPDASSLFRRHFDYPPVHRVCAPLGLALLGQHADIDLGLAVTVALNRAVHFACAPRADGRIELVGPGMAESVRFWLSDLQPRSDVGWAADVKAVLERLRRRGVNFSGFSAAVESDPMIGLATSESPLFALAAALALRQLYPFSLTETGATLPPRRNSKNELPPLAPAEKWHYANLCGSAGVAGVPNELPLPPDRCSLRTAASLFGKAWQAVSMDLGSRSVEYAPLVGATIVLCRPDEKTGTLENGCASLSGDPSAQAMRSACGTAATRLGFRSLRSVELKVLEANKSRLAEREYGCVRHFVSETARVVAAERALREDDLAQFGQYLLQSSESLGKALPEATSQIEPLIKLAGNCPGWLGSCLAVGAGISGTINLVAHHQAPEFAEAIALEFERRSGTTLAVAICQIVDGAA